MTETEVLVELSWESQTSLRKCTGPRSSRSVYLHASIESLFAITRLRRVTLQVNTDCTYFFVQRGFHFVLNKTGLAQCFLIALHVEFWWNIENVYAVLPVHIWADMTSIRGIILDFVNKSTSSKDMKFVTRAPAMYGLRRSLRTQWFTLVHFNGAHHARSGDIKIDITGGVSLLCSINQ
jgi:hypothetical protein